MLCYSCEKVKSCHTFQTLYAMSKDFEIKDCRDYDAVSTDKYKLISQNDDLMMLLYDYFTDNLKLPYEISDEEIRKRIKEALLEM